MPAAPGRTSLASLTTETVQTITISRHFTAEQEGERAQNRPEIRRNASNLQCLSKLEKATVQPPPHVRVCRSLAVSPPRYSLLFLTLTHGREVCVSPAHGHKSINTAAAAHPRVRGSVRPLPHPPSTRDPARHPSSITRLQRSARPAQVTTSPKTEKRKKR